MALEMADTQMPLMFLVQWQEQIPDYFLRVSMI
jgi:hypothetical protein